MAWYRAAQKTLIGGKIPDARIGHTMTHIPGPAIPSVSDPSSRPIPSPGHCILFGGYDGKNCLNSVNMLSVENLEWTSMSCIGDIPDERTGHCAAHIGGGRIMVFGGRNKTHYFENAYILDTATAVWTKTDGKMLEERRPQPKPRLLARAPPLPETAGKTHQILPLITLEHLGQPPPNSKPVDGPSNGAEQACVAQNGRLLVWGGSNGSSYGDSMLSYDPREGVWYTLNSPETAASTAKYTMEPPTRIGHCLIARPDVATLLLIGGVSECLLDSWKKHQTMTSTGGFFGGGTGSAIAWKDFPDAPLRVYDCRMTKWFQPLTDVVGAASLNRRSSRVNHVAALTPTGIVVQGGLDYNGRMIQDWFLIHPWTLQGLKRPVAEVEETPGSKFGHSIAVALSRGALVFGGGDLVDDGGSTNLRLHSEMHVMAW